MSKYTYEYGVESKKFGQDTTTTWSQDEDEARQVLQLIGIFGHSAEFESGPFLIRREVGEVETLFV